MKPDRKLLALPIDLILPELNKALAAGPNLVLQASPGSGKTTRVPPSLLNAGFRKDKEILVLEPRRLAAKYAARRVAEELGEEVGLTVGYQFRFENVSSSRTRLRFLTEGMLMRRLLRDSRLEGVAAVLLDEFHERHLHGDIALGYLRWLQANARPDLRIVVMSATLDSESVAAYLGNCPILRVDTRLFPVENEFLPGPASKPLEFLVKEAVQRALREKGNVLVFLPGMGEIRRCAEALQSLSGGGPGGVRVLPLHGELSREEQDLAVGRTDFTKVILATNVAETSLTIEGVTTVVDSGLHRSASHSWWSGVPALRTRPISRASAIQRAGRAGRTAPGRCLRLYSKFEYESRPAFEVPEIQRADITQTLLELKQLGIRNARAFPWFEAPSAQSLDAASLLLFRLGALDSFGNESGLTELGRRMSELPAHPRLARVCLEAEKLGVLEDAATLAALMGEGRLERLDALENLRGGVSDAGVRRVRTQLLSSFSNRRVEAPRASPLSAEDRLRFCLLTGFPDRVASKRKVPAHSDRARVHEVELLFSAGGSARMEETGILAEGEDFVTLDILENQRQGQTRSQLRIRCLSLIRPEWLFDLTPSLVEEKEALSWDAASSQVVLLSQMTHDQLVLTESRTRPEPRPQPEWQKEITRVLARGALGLELLPDQPISAQQWAQALSQVGDPEAIANAFHRILLLWKHFPPAAGAGPDRIQMALEPLLAGKLSMRELKETDWALELPAALIPEYLDRVGTLLPEQVTLKGGRKVKVNYPPDQPPWIESRLQDFFGMKQGPSILNGRIPLTLHLLAPNYRAVQVTTDLAGFWQRGYREVKPALSRRYPRHPWPEDPAHAEPPEPRPQRSKG